MRLALMVLALAGCLSSADVERNARADRASAARDGLTKLLWLDCRAAILPARCAADSACDDRERDRFLARTSDQIEWLVAHGCPRGTIDARLASTAAWIETPAKPVSCRSAFTMAQERSVGAALLSLPVLPLFWLMPWLCPGP